MMDNTPMTLREVLEVIDKSIAVQRWALTRVSAFTKAGFVMPEAMQRETVDALQASMKALQSLREQPALILHDAQQRPRKSIVTAQKREHLVKLFGPAVAREIIAYNENKTRH